MAVSSTSCSRSGRGYYELEGGDKSIDWIEFANDSTIRWVAPGKLAMESIYEEEDGVITVYVAPFSKGTLHRVDSYTLVGEVPFFEGTWKRKRR